jgi:hypothetical protein
VGHGIAPRDKALSPGTFDKTMQIETAVAQGKDDLARAYIGQRATRDLDQVARPERGQHAGAANLQAQTATAAQSVHG